MKLNDRINWLKKRGCHPSIYQRGNMWRAHVNVYGNFWADASTAHKAMEDAVRLWRENRYPMDGAADMP